VKIGHILDDRIDKPDGVQQVVRGLGEWMRAQGHEVHYIVGETEDTSAVPNIHVAARNLPVSFNGNKLSIPLPTAQRKLRRLMSELDLDILHVHVPYSPFMGAKAIKGSAQHVAVTGTFHVLPYNFFARYGTKLLGFWLRSSLKRFHSLYGGTPAAAGFASWSMGIQAEVMPHPIDFKLFEPARHRQPDDGKLRIVFLGRLVPRKGAFQLVKAIAGLSPDIRATIAVHIGGKGELQPAIEAYIKKNQLEDTVQLDGFIEEKAKPAYLAQADIAIFPSIAGESFGISLLEPMAAGAGITVGGSNPGYSAVLADWPEALFDAKDSTVFTKYLQGLIADPALRERIGTQQRAAVAQYDINLVGKRWLGVYADAVASSTARPKQ
jgi:phosphatidylinositol alpha-mannosyltransferase